MIYLWEYPDNRLNKEIGLYDDGLSPDRYTLYYGTSVKDEEFTPIPIVRFAIPTPAVLQFDCLASNAPYPLINDKTKAILEKVAPDEVQFFPTKLICKDGELNGYYFINATKTFEGIDREKSTYSLIDGTENAILGFRSVIYKPNSMGSLHIARSKDYLGHFCVNKEVKHAFEEAKIRGAWFITPEDYYRRLYG
jgi:hypothetical protein